jgi:cytochrome c556
MRRTVVAILALVVALAAVLIMQQAGPDGGEQQGGPDGGEPQAGPGDGEGWTGLSEPEEVIEARRVLMIQMQPLMRPIDAFAAGEAGDPPALRSAAATLEAMLMAFPHLFPPTTNRYDPTTRESPTLALPAIWEDFAAFRTVSETAVTAAATMAAAEDAESLRTAGRSLRASCDGCHAVFAKPYTPPKVTQDDLEFDFDSVFPQK